MSKLSTQCMENFKKTDKNNCEVSQSPRKQTLDLLKQFARVYHAEPTTCTGFCGYVLN